MSPRLALLPLAALALMVVGGSHPPPAPGLGPATAAPGHLAWPLTGWVMTQGYGCTTFELEPVAPWCPSGHFHSGIDLAAAAGTPVHAAAAGLARVAEDPAG